MAITTEGKIGIGLALVQALGTGIVLVAPDAGKPVGWVLLILATLGLIGLGLHHGADLWRRRHQPGERTKMLSFVGLVACLLGAVGFGVWHFWPGAATSPQAELARSDTDEAIQNLRDTIVGKNEVELQQQFQIPGTLSANIDVQRMYLTSDANAKMHLGVSTYSFLQGGTAILQRDTMRLAPGEWVPIDHPERQIFISIPKQASAEIALLTRYSMAGILPDVISTRVNDLVSAVNRNLTAMQTAIFAARTKGSQYILEDKNPTSPHFYAIEKEFWSSYIPLQPLAKELALAIRDYQGRRKE
jgi:hypothetical protein